MAKKSKTTETNTMQNIKDVSIVEEMKKSYLDYSMSVIVSRALPDVRDGLKPVQRRILYAMHKLKLVPGKSYKKSAQTVGVVMAKYHPHGDSSIYEAMVRMAQDFNSRYQLVDGQGNFGSIDGDSAAAMRYTEARMQKISTSMLSGISKDTVDFRPTYDGTNNEPSVLPTKVPALLLNGADGIAVGMATKIPPHNLGEVVDGILAIIKKGNKSENSTGIRGEFTKEELAEQKKGIFSVRKWEKHPEFETDLTAEDLVEYIKGPDFPTGASMYGQKDILEIYATGRGRVVTRATAKIEENKSGRYQIVITELPFQVNKARLVGKIGELARDKKIVGVKDLRDESNKEGIRVVLDISSTGKPKVILNKLYKFTEMQKAFNANMLALVDNEPQTLTLKKILELFVKHRQEVTIRKTEFDLAAAKSRSHILEGLKIALDHLDEVIKTIRASKTQEAAKTNLIKKFDFSEIQAQAILDMQLRRLAALERKKIEDEYKEVQTDIKKMEALLASPEEILKVVATELEEVREKYADDRRTKVFKGRVGELSEEDLVAEENVIVTMSHQGYIKRMKTDVYKRQKRGGKGVLGAKTKDTDNITHVLECSTHDALLFFTSKGRAFEVKVHEIPEYSRQAKGIPVINIVQVDTNEVITSLLKKAKENDEKIVDEDQIQEDQEGHHTNGAAFLFMGTEKGLVKKTAMEHFANIRSKGLVAIKLDADDQLKWVHPTTGSDHIILVTQNGRAIKFHEKNVRPTGRATRGVTGIRFKTDDDLVVGADVVRKEEDRLFVISENGIGKMTKLSEYPLHKRAGQGVFTSRITAKTGKIAIMRIMDHPDREIVLISDHGKIIRVGITGVPTLSRQTSGVKIMNLDKEDTVAAMAVLEKSEEAEEEAEEKQPKKKK